MTVGDGAAAYRADPLGFVEDIIGAVPTDQQREVLQALEGNKPIAVRSGHGIGKTAVEAWAILWFMATHPNARVPATAPTGHQLEDILWPEIKLWLQRSAVKDFFEWTKTRLAPVGSDRETWFAVPRSSSVPENLQGFHGRHVLFVIDEASGVDQEIMEVVEGALTNDGARLLMMGNPTQLAGTFYDAFHKDRGLYRTFTFDAEKSPLVSKEYCERIATKYGRESDVYRVRVLGLFPKGEPDTFIRLDAIEAAIQRSVEEAGRFFIGVDPARFGDDESVICWRHGMSVKPFRGFHGINTTRLSAEVAMLCREIRSTGHYGPIEVRIDETGIGAGVVDQFDLVREKLGAQLIPINFGGAGDEEYADKGARMWGAVRSALPGLSLPDDDDLAAQLTTRKYKIQPDGRIKLERKEDMKKRGLPSPDRGDALALCVSDETPPSLGKQTSKRKPVTAGLRNTRF